MAATYEPIATTTLGSAASSITFSSIPATYTDLVVVITATTTAGNDVYLRFNSDTGTNYSYTRLSGDGTSASSGGSTNDTYIGLNRVNGTSSTIPFFAKVDIFSYAGSTNKTALVHTSNDQNGSGTVDETVGLWRNTTSINSVTFTTLSTTFKTGSTATIYGILKA